jgi:hypothetical protein
MFFCHILFDATLCLLLLCVESVDAKGHNVLAKAMVLGLTVMVPILACLVAVAFKVDDGQCVMML